MGIVPSIRRTCISAEAGTGELSRPAEAHLHGVRRQTGEPYVSSIIVLHLEIASFLPYLYSRLP